METIRGLFIGVSAHQKLEHLTLLVRLLGYESAAIFGDCFDEVLHLPSLPANLIIAVIPHSNVASCKKTSAITTFSAKC